MGFTLVNHLYKTGTTNKVNSMEEISPPINVHPSGDHKLVPENVKGISPRIVVRVVSKIGVNLLSAAC